MCLLFWHRFFKYVKVMKDKKGRGTNEMITNATCDLWILEHTAIKEKADGEI